MIVRKFMQWATSASAAERAEGAGSLARAYLYAGLAPADKREAEVALTALLDDPAPLVRKAISEAFASAPDAPPTVVVALANDQSEVAAPVLGRSPLLADADLIDCAAVGDAFAQAAIALRAPLAAPVAAALAEVGAREALIALAVNPDADIPDFSLGRMVERFGADGELREAMLTRPLPASVRSDLVVAAAAALKSFVIGCAWLSPERAARVEREACDKAHVIIADDAERARDWAGARDLVARLREAGRLTSGLALRALLSGNACLFEATLVELSGLPESKALPLARDWRGAGFAALYNRSGLPPKLMPAFVAALAAAREHAQADRAGGKLSRAIIARVLAVCAGADDLGSLAALLRRLDVEAAREEAREAARYIFTPQVEAPVVVAIDQGELGAAPRIIAIDLEAIEAELAA